MQISVRPTHRRASRMPLRSLITQQVRVSWRPPRTSSVTTSVKSTPGSPFSNTFSNDCSMSSVEMRLILLDGQRVPAFPLDDPGGDVFLTAHRVDRYYGPFKIQKLEQLRNGRDFVGFRMSRHLAQGQVILHRPGADHVQRGL